MQNQESISVTKIVLSFFSAAQVLAPVGTNSIIEN